MLVLLGTNMSRSVALLLLTVLVLSSLVMIASVCAQSIPKPSVPEFTVEYVSGTVEVRIENQPFTPMVVQEGTTTWTVEFYYNIRVKEHHEENWVNLYSPAVVPLNPSNSDYTLLSFLLTLSPTHPEQGYILESYHGTSGSYFPSLTGLDSDAQIDFQVEAMVGYLSRTVEFASWHFTGETSGWSSTQTIKIGDSQPSTPEPTSTPTSSPSQENLLTQEQSVILGLTVTVVVLSAGLGWLLYLIKRK
jgi:hypothetical protein